MKELLREREFVRVGYFQSLLEAAGIPTFMRNENLSVTEVSIPDFFPALCVVNDGDYEQARQIIQEQEDKSKESSGTDCICDNCGESCPGNFELCWNCGAPLT
ncbi:MAG: DUF2007 domain-containing protein [Luteolibacter sp.]